MSRSANRAKGTNPVMQSPMLPYGAAHAACLALVALPTSHATQTQQFAGCAFCGGHASSFGASSLRRRTRVVSSSSSRSSSSSSTTTGSGANSHPSACSPLLFDRSGGVGAACRGKADLFAAAASRWNDDDGDTDDRGREGRRRRRGPKPLRAPWEDIQWNNPEGKVPRGGDRAEWQEEEEEEEEEEVLGLGQRRRRARRANVRDYDDDFDDDDDDDDRPRRRRTGRASRGRADGLDTEPLPSGWDASGWFSGAQQANQGGIFDWMRSFYNTLFWYGGASSEDYDELPAMNFQDLLERYDLPAIEQSSGRPRPIVPPEDLAAEQDFRWRPSGGDSAAAAAAAAEARIRRRRRRSSAVDGGVAGSSRQRARRDRDREPQWEEEEEFERVKRGWGREGGGNKRDAVAIGQLRRKQRQLADREHKCEMDLDKVRERLSVVDATVELWMRRSAGMLSRGSSETDTDVLQAKRRIYGLKDEGRQLDSATVELEGRLEDCRAKLDRIVQELELLGEEAVPQVFYTPEEDLELKTAAEAEKEEGGKPLGVETRAVEVDGLELQPEKQRDVEAVPAVGDPEA